MDLAKDINRKKSAVHPCFDSCAGTHARIHLPVAGDCNIQCNYCRRKFSCVNESRPGVTAVVLSPGQAFERCMKARERLPNLTVVGIAGPGDALACAENTVQTLRLIRQEWKEAVFCFSTNGLLLDEYADTLADCGVSHITVTVNSLVPETARRIYRHIDLHGVRFTGTEAAEILIEKQLAGIRRASALGIVCKVNTVFIGGLNESEIPNIAAQVKEAGADIMNIMQLIPVKHTLFEDVPLVSNEIINEMRTRCEPILPQMRHCKQCRADAAGTLDNDISREFTESTPDFNEKNVVADNKKSLAKKMLVAVASKNGVLVDEHFGHAESFYIYRWDGEKAELLEKRPIAQQYCGSDAHGCGSGGHGKFEALLDAISDCQGVLAMRIGEVPRQLLAEHGIRVFMSYDYIEEALRQLAMRNE
ncbi:MAG: nitrogenase cofactor biosynthesis protein NifB [Spirochaetaceae bacterium]|jgi:nitrogenase cofactor biosynthesis protein NifB|nr:nitrogenase cofactor biosynthesis protein NifB [Spirochaetaceae bacterium]